MQKFFDFLMSSRADRDAASAGMKFIPGCWWTASFFPRHAIDDMVSTYHRAIAFSANVRSEKDIHLYIILPEAA